VDFTILAAYLAELLSCQLAIEFSDEKYAIVGVTADILVIRVDRHGARLALDIV